MNPFRNRQPGVDDETTADTTPDTEVETVEKSPGLGVTGKFPSDDVAAPETEYLDA